MLQPKAGFGAHPHRDAEIFSYIVKGELSHKVGVGAVETPASARSARLAWRGQCRVPCLPGPARLEGPVASQSDCLDFPPPLSACRTAWATTKASRAAASRWGRTHVCSSLPACERVDSPARYHVPCCCNHPPVMPPCCAVHERGDGRGALGDERRRRDLPLPAGGIVLLLGVVSV